MSVRGAHLPAWLRGLGNSYRQHHESNPALLQWIGGIGCAMLTAFFLIRLTGRLPQRWDDLWFRLPAIVLCLLLALRPWWPARLRGHYIAYSWFAAFYCLAFFLPLTLLENGGAPNTVANMMLGAGLLVLVADWRNTAVMILGGYVLSVGWFLAVHGAGAFPMQFLYWWAPLCLVLAAGGCVARFVERRAELERLRLYAALAGSVAHEVRGPLARVQYSLEIAQELVANAGGDQAHHGTGTGQELARALQAGVEAVQRALQAVTITLNQVSAKGLDSAGFARLSAVACTQKALAEYAFESDAQRDCVSMQIEGDFHFHGDETAFVLVIFNLLKNALYYLPLKPAMQVTVLVRALPSPCIVVRDTGPGVPPARIANLFEEFRSVGKADGSGLGLAFCARVMQAFGGGIAVRSAAGEFTMFTLRFPPPMQARAPSGPSGPSDTSGTQAAG